MKTFKALCLSTFALAATLSASNADALMPGEIDFGAFSAPKSGAQFVEVNVGKTLISLASRFVVKEEPEIAKLLDSVHLVRVTVVGMDEDNRADLSSRVQKVRKDLNTKGWERLVTAQDRNQDVGIFLKGDKEKVQGVAVVVLDNDRQAVFVNIVGNIRPEQISEIGERLHIDQLKGLPPATRAH